MSMKGTEKDTVREIEEYFEKQLERTNSWLSFAEAKNAGLIAVNIALLAVIIELFSQVPVLCVISVTITLLSSLFCLVSFVPNLNKAVDKVKRKRTNKSVNLTFYGDIADLKSTEQYVNKVLEAYYSKNDKISNMARDLAAEVLINSQITMRKYQWFNIALKIDLLAILSIIIMFIAA